MGGFSDLPQAAFNPLHNKLSLFCCDVCCGTYFHQKRVSYVTTFVEKGAQLSAYSVVRSPLLVNYDVIRG
jgi:hypothetical protein